MSVFNRIAGLRALRPFQAQRGGIRGTVAEQVLASTDLRSSVTQHGITWTFDKEYEVGQFVTGDWWVMPDEPGGTVTVVNVDPAPTGSGESFRNGSMVNPINADGNGVDGRVVAFDQNASVTYPYALSADKSLVSTISHDEIVEGRALDAAAILTCLAKPPYSDQFRPPYCGDNKPVYRASTLRISALPAVQPPASAPGIEYCEALVERVWLDHWQSGSPELNRLNPTSNMANYGREIARDIGNVALMLCCDPEVVGNKTALARYMTQRGIDYYHALDTGSSWPALGGFNSGRKLPILVAGFLLDNSDMLGIGTTYPGSSNTFQEDGQTFIVDQDTLDRTHRYDLEGYAQSWSSNTLELEIGPYDPAHEKNGYLSGLDIEITEGTGTGQRRNNIDFTASTNIVTVSPAWNITPDATSKYRVINFEEEDLGTAFWSPNHWTGPEEDTASWRRSYLSVSSTSWASNALAARMIGLVDEWNYAAFFNYVDRWMEAATPTGDAPYYEDARTNSAFAEAMWDEYRSSY